MTATATMKFTKVDRGWYATEDGRYAVMVDGYERGQHIGEVYTTTGHYEGFIGGEWAAIFCARGEGRIDAGAGENIDWFPTKRAAIECAQRDAARRARTGA